MAEAELDEIHQDDGVTHHDTGAGHKADHGGGREKGVQPPVSGQDTDQSKGDDYHDHQRCHVILEPADHQHVDKNHDGTEGQAEVAEDLQGDMPLAAPFHGRFGLGKGLVHVVDLHCRVFSAKVPAVQFGQFFVHGKDGINRTLEYPGHIADDIDDRFQVLAINRLSHGLLLNMDQFPERHQGRPGVHVRTQGHVEDARHPGTLCLRQFQDNIGWFVILGLVEKINGQAVQTDLDGPRHLALRDVV